MPIDADGAAEIASRSRGTPRVANRLLRRVRDYAQVRADGAITAAVARAALKLLEVDDHGFDEVDRRLLLTIIQKFGGGPVGVNALAAAISEEPDAIEDIYEPYLLQHGFLDRTPRGRDRDPPRVRAPGPAAAGSPVTGQPAEEALLTRRELMAGHPSDHDLAAYEYELPPDLVAQQPLARRDASRLLVLDRETGALAHRAFSDLPDLLRPGDLLVTNRSRVLPARLLGRRPGGGAAEILLVRREEADVWEAMVRPGRRLRPGTTVDVAPGFRVRVEDAPAPRGTTAPLARERRRPRRCAASACSWTGSTRPARSSATATSRCRPTSTAPTSARTASATRPSTRASPARSRRRRRGCTSRPSCSSASRARRRARASSSSTSGPGTFRPVEAADVRDHRVDAERFTRPRRRPPPP